ncbi:TauD/TfdA family dioxygenase [Saccharopolyspora hattusasensis]|uniref:TauD/TfdA family dioxygenase n=1 Tax=Saccharopolyspora hattusasensis TaxID=1128679 RepID=UPI003D9524D1
MDHCGPYYPAGTIAPRRKDHGKATMTSVLETLTNQGWALIDSAGFTDGSDVDYREVERIASRYGTASDRDGGQAIWPVTPRKSGSTDTFSVRAGEARFHTDAAYRAEPEQRFALFCVRPAEDGGASRLLQARKALSGLPGEMSALLRKPVWRWIPPATFGGEPDIPRSVSREDGRIRWRVDNLDVDSALRSVATDFDEHLDSHPDAAEFVLGTDSVLICDNERVLHGRTWFSDPRRLILRVRLVIR